MHFLLMLFVLQEYSQSADYLVPDVVCAFNCGFHEFAGSGNEQDTWTESLPHLTKHCKVPLIFTSYTKTEALKDLELVKKSRDNLEVLVSGQRNPFRSHRPIRDYECDDDCDVFYSNNYFSLMYSKE